jgi:hypothetical protein
MGKSKKGGSSSHHSGDKWKREPTPPSEDFGDSEYSEEEFSSESEGSPVHASPPASSDDSDDSQGLAAEVWTYIRAIERAGLEGSDEENSSDSSEEGGGNGDGGDDDDCWRLVLKCYELRTRQHKMLNINALHPLKHYLPMDLMSFGRRSWAKISRKSYLRDQS